LRNYAPRWPGEFTSGCCPLCRRCPARRPIGIVGRLSNVKVAEKAAGKVKFASAHDLRRSFGERWAARVMRQVLLELMRHESIETTLGYYVGRNAQNTASVLYDAAKRAAGESLGVSVDSSQETKSPATTEVITGQPFSQRGAGRS
jgi:hypothetical protein